MQLRRYFVLDHTAQKMRIHKTNDPHSDYKIYDYLEILSVNFKPETSNEQKTIQARWSFGFVLNTSKRKFNLYSTSQDEMTLWTHTFFWIIQRNMAQKDKFENEQIEKQKL
jgi:hypothetical protein